MLNNQKSPICKIGLEFDDSKASTSETKNMSFIGSSAEKATYGSTIKVHESTLPGSVCLRTYLEPDEWIKDSGCSKHMTGKKSLFSTYKAYDRCNVVFGSNLKGNIIGKGTDCANLGTIRLRRDRRVLVMVARLPRTVYHDLYLGGKALAERENVGFDLARPLP
ncbi:hypothetical protein Tco_0698075 [Tanacetum coccineum]